MVLYRKRNFYLIDPYFLQFQFVNDPGKRPVFFMSGVTEKTSRKERSQIHVRHSQIRVPPPPCFTWPKLISWVCFSNFDSFKLY